MNVQDEHATLKEAVRHTPIYNELHTAGPSWLRSKHSYSEFLDTLPFSQRSAAVVWGLEYFLPSSHNPALSVLFRWWETGQYTDTIKALMPLLSEMVSFKLHFSTEINSVMMEFDGLVQGDELSEYFHELMIDHPRECSCKPTNEEEALCDCGYQDGRDEYEDSMLKIRDLSDRLAAAFPYFLLEFESYLDFKITDGLKKII